MLWIFPFILAWILLRIMQICILHSIWMPTTKFTLEFPFKLSHWSYGNADTHNCGWINHSRIFHRFSILFKWYAINYAYVWVFSFLNKKANELNGIPVLGSTHIPTYNDMFMNFCSFYVGLIQTHRNEFSNYSQFCNILFASCIWIKDFSPEKKRVVHLAILFVYKSQYFRKRKLMVKYTHHFKKKFIFAF